MKLQVINGEFDISSFYIFFRRVWLWVYNSLSSLVINFGGAKFSILSFSVALLVMSIVISVAFNLIKVNTDSFSSRSIKSSNKKTGTFNNKKAGEK